MLNNLKTQNLKYFLKNKSFYENVETKIFFTIRSFLKNRVNTIKKFINKFDLNTKKCRTIFQEFEL